MDDKRFEELRQLREAHIMDDHDCCCKTCEEFKVAFRKYYATRSK